MLVEVDGNSQLILYTLGWCAKMTKEERKKREKEDGKADVGEFFGI